MIQKTRQWTAVGDSRPRRPVDQMDVWLESQGFYRKHTARDGTCLFRAVAEQLFFTQVYHSDVRRATVEYILRNPGLFQPMVDEPIDIYAERMRSLKEYGGRVEIAAISVMYKHDFMMYGEIGQPAQMYTNNGFSSKITLCQSLERHYDSVFTKDYINDAALCQSLVYEMLYKKVFELKEVDYAVSKMLHDKSNKQQLREHVSFIDCFSIRYEMRDSYNNVRDLLELGITPFPYKVAKALDAEVYRNVEYDTWTDYRKGLRYGFCTWTCRDLQVGVKCSVKIDENTTHIGHIQEMAPNKGPVVVYIEKIGQMMTVPYKSLTMLPPPPVVLTPARPSPTLNLKYASLLTSMAIKKSINPKEDQVAKIKRPTKLPNVQKNKSKDEAPKSRIGKPQDVRRDNAQDSKYRSEYSQAVEDGQQPHTIFPRRGNIGGLDSGGGDKQEAVSQIYMPIEGSRNHVYILNAQPVGANHSAPVPVPDNQPPAAFVPMAVVPLQVNLMAQKSVNLDGSDLPHTDMSTLRFCYNLGVDCLRMNCLTWTLRPTSQAVVNTASTLSQPPGYMAIESHRALTENVVVSDGRPAEEQMVQTGAAMVAPMVAVGGNPYQYIVPSGIDNSGDSKGGVGSYEELLPIQHPEISSTTPTTPGTYYYPPDYEHQVCPLPGPYMEYFEYVYEMGAPQSVFPSYPVSYVSPDGAIYHPVIPVPPPPAGPQSQSPAM